MKLLVTVKRVEDYEVKIKVKPDGSGIVTDQMKYVVNPFDEIAVEEALRVRDAQGSGEVVAATPNGKRIALSIAPGTKAGKVIRVRGKGIPGLAGAPAGDLLLHVRITVPTKLDEEQKKLYEQLRDALARQSSSQAT